LNEGITKELYLPYKTGRNIIEVLSQQSKDVQMKLMYFVLLALPFMVNAQTKVTETCPELFHKRGESLETAKRAHDCALAESKAATDNLTKAEALNRLSYTKFFIAETYLKEKEEMLLDAINLSEKTILLFGVKYAIPEYMKLSAAERKVLAEALYNYGVATSRYIEIKGQWEAIKRMEDIKRSMNSILRMKEEATAVYGAYRTLGIFHMKVPSIAGGKIELSEDYLKKAVSLSIQQGEVSLYPANNLALADLFHKLGKKDEACNQIKAVAELKAEDVASWPSGLVHESISSLAKARELAKTRKCL
jgi:tetratricopeptide (TPR) repeat protein